MQLWEEMQHKLGITQPALYDSAPPDVLNQAGWQCRQAVPPQPWRRMCKNYDRRTGGGWTYSNLRFRGGPRGRTSTTVSRVIVTLLHGRHQHMEASHLCDNKRCCHPSHLVPLSRRHNQHMGCMKRGGADPFKVVKHFTHLQATLNQPRQMELSRRHMHHTTVTFAYIRRPDTATNQTALNDCTFKRDFLAKLFAVKDVFATVGHVASNLPP